MSDTSPTIVDSETTDDAEWMTWVLGPSGRTAEITTRGGNRIVGVVTRALYSGDACRWLLVDTGEGEPCRVRWDAIDTIQPWSA